MLVRLCKGAAEYEFFLPSPHAPMHPRYLFSASPCLRVTVSNGFFIFCFSPASCLLRSGYPVLSLPEFCILFIPAKSAFSNRDEGDGGDGGQSENTASHLLIYHLFFSVYPFLSPLSPSSLLNPLLCFASEHWAAPRPQTPAGGWSSRFQVTDHRLPITDHGSFPDTPIPACHAHGVITPILFLPPPPYLLFHNPLSPSSYHGMSRSR